MKVAVASACGWNFKALPYSDNLSGWNRASSLYGYANSTFQTSHFHDNDWLLNGFKHRANRRIFQRWFAFGRSRRRVRCERVSHITFVRLNYSYSGAKNGDIMWKRLVVDKSSHWLRKFVLDCVVRRGWMARRPATIRAGAPRILMIRRSLPSCV